MESRFTNHPVAPFIVFVRHQISEECDCLIILPGLDVSSQLVHRLDCIGLEQILIVQVIKQNVQPFLRVCDMRLEVRWRFGFHALHVSVENFVDGTRRLWNVGPITSGCRYVSRELRTVVETPYGA